MILLPLVSTVGVGLDAGQHDLVGRTSCIKPAEVCLVAPWSPASPQRDVACGPGC